MIQNYINHVVFIVDRSGSMSHLREQTIKVFDNQVDYLATRSKELNQETRASIYLFGNQVECLVYDIDVLRLPSIKDHYKADGQTKLIDGAIQAIKDLKQTPELYGDHAFLIYLLTDGQENHSDHSASDLKVAIEKLPENWTLAVYVPDQNGVFEAKKFGFPAQNIQIWSTTNEGIREVGKVLREVTNNFMENRAKGIRGTKTLFSLDTTKLDTSTVKAALQELPANQYELLAVHKDTDIKTFVESWIKEPYRKGSSYYMLMKPEIIQNHKQVVIQEKTTGKVYTGANARKILALPDYEVKVAPADFGKFDLYIQSTSSNRKLIGGTKLIVLK